VPAHLGVLVVVEAGAPQVAVVHREAQRLDQVQGAAGVGREADHVAGVGRDLGRDEHDVEHARIVAVQPGASVRASTTAATRAARPASAPRGGVQRGAAGHHVVHQQHALAAHRIRAQGSRPNAPRTLRRAPRDPARPAAGSRKRSSSVPSTLRAPAGAPAAAPG
jgi:hypothetical protein